MEWYDEILENTLGEFQRKASCFVGDASDEAIKFRIIASELARLYEQLDLMKEQIFPDTATGEFLERHGAARGLYRKNATPAQGKVIFFAASAVHSDILIPAGTLISSSKESQFTLVTMEDATLPAEAECVEVLAQTTEAGKNANIAPHYADILVTPIAGISRVDNADPITGGGDGETEESFRARLLESVNRLSNGANLAYYEQFARAFPDVWYAKACYTPGVDNEISLYVENYTRNLPEETRTALQAALEEARELNIRLVVKKPATKEVSATIRLTVSNLANEMVIRSETQELLETAVLSLGIGERFSPARMSALLLENPGVLDVTFQTPTAPVTIAEGEICLPGRFILSAERG